MRFANGIAQHLRDVHFGGNWTAVNFRDVLSDVTVSEATTRFLDMHPIATLLFHTHYFVVATIDVLKNGKLDAKDRFSFDCPPLETPREWADFQQRVWDDVEQLAELMDQLSNEQLADIFVDKQYGNYYRCLQGVVEHCHYHLGQIVIQKRLLKRQSSRTLDAK